MTLTHAHTEAGLPKSGMKEVLFKEAYEQVCVGRGHLCTHGSFLDLEVILEVKGEMVVCEDELSILDKELREWQGEGGAFVKELF